jgi:hypothetical protein
MKIKEAQANENATHEQFWKTHVKRKKYTTNLLKKRNSKKLHVLRKMIKFSQVKMKKWKK